MVEAGRYYLRVDRCLYGEVVQDLEDLELAEMHECYGDFITPSMRNENFVLTRTRTIMGGHPFCDFCYHDKQIVKEIKHPKEEFWEKFTAD